MHFHQIYHKSACQCFMNKTMNTAQAVMETNDSYELVFNESFRVDKIGICHMHPSSMNLHLIQQHKLDYII